MTDPSLISAAAAMPWWVWPVLLFAVCVLLGVVAVPAGIGGGVLYVPIVGGLFPFHLDFVRGAGLMVALASSLAASPRLLRMGLASLHLALPLSLAAALGQLAGALAGLALPAPTVQILLGAFILIVAAVMTMAESSTLPAPLRADPIAAALNMHGVFHDAECGGPVQWNVHRSALALAVFAMVGVLAGMFGIGAGFANVPALCLIMGAPMKVAAGTSSLILGMSSSGAWVYLSHGAMLPAVVVPSMLGTMLGATLGVRLLRRVPVLAVRRLVILLLLAAGVRALAKGFGIF